MQDGTLVVVALVGLAVVCVGAFFVAFVLLLRFARSRSIWLRQTGGFLSMLLGERENDNSGGRITTTPRPDLRTIAESHDFDAALAKQVVRPVERDEIEPNMGKYPATQATPDTGFEDIPSLKPRKDDRRANVRRDDDDDMFGDMLD